MKGCQFVLFARRRERAESMRLRNLDENIGELRWCRSPLRDDSRLRSGIPEGVRKLRGIFRTPHSIIGVFSSNCGEDGVVSISTAAERGAHAANVPSATGSCCGFARLRVCPRLQQASLPPSLPGTSFLAGVDCQLDDDEDEDDDSNNRTAFLQH